MWRGQVDWVVSPERPAKEAIRRRTPSSNWKTGNLGSELGKGIRVRDPGQQCEH